MKYYLGFISFFIIFFASTTLYAQPCTGAVTGCDILVKPIRIAMGTTAITTPDAQGRTFESYTKYKLEGKLASGTSTITNTNTGGTNGTSSQALYQNLLYSEYLDYHFAMPNGSYTVILHYVESYWNSTTPRQFDVYLEDVKVENNFDIYATAGNIQNKAVVKSYTTTVTGNDLSVIFKKQVDNPAVAGIEIIPNFCVTTQSVTISKSTVSGCYTNALQQSKATVSVEVAWNNALPSDSIKVVLGTQIHWIKPGQYNTNSNVGSIISPQVIAFEVDADGTANIITASMYKNATCTTSTANYTAPVACPAPICTTGNLGGTVFNDYNADGIKDTGETAGLQGVTIKAFDCSGNLVGTAMTDIYGKYVFSPVITATAYPIRVEFSGLSAIYTQGTLNGADGRTTTQFIPSADCNVDLGVLNPNDYCQSNPKIIIPCYVSGDPLIAGTASNSDAVVSFDYVASGLQNTAIMAHAPTSQVGSLWGMAYNKFTKKIFSSATLKRHSGLGPLGLGGIYISDFSTIPANGATFNYTNFIDVSTIGINVGTIANNATRNLVGDKTQPSIDNAAYSAIGKVGIGGIDISEDGNKLYLTNLFDNKLYVIDITTYNTSATLPTAANVTSFDMSAGISCTNGNLRTWAVKVNKGKIYTGMICDASTSQNKSDLRAYIQQLNGSTVSTIFDFPLTYPKGFILNLWLSATGWYPWSDDFNTSLISNQHLHPEPILSAIEFDIDGSMVLAFADRKGIQGGGTNNYSPNGGTNLYETRAAGDILRAYTTGNTFVLENNAKAGTSIGYGANNNQGPGFGEFYNENEFINSGSGVILAHAETVIGGLALRPGSGEAIVPVVDPLDMPLGGDFNSYLYAAGVRHLNNQTGLNNKGYLVYNGYSSGSFGKGAGLGDVVLTCDIAKHLQIGSYVWLDADKDGVQDPCEIAISGVKVSLYKDVAGTLTKIAETTTATNGEYYFSSKSKLGAKWTGIAADTTLLPNQAYKVIFGETQYNAGLLTVSGANYFLTQKDATTNTGNDQNDNDAAEMSIGGTMYPSIAITTGVWGSVNHTLDAGFICPTITNPSSTQTLCTNDIGSNITINTDINTTNSIKFVKFSTDQTTTNGSETAAELAAIYAGTALGTSVTPTGASSSYTATYIWNATDFPNTGVTTLTYYVYAILANGTLCKPVKETKIIVSPTANVTAGIGTNPAVICQKKSGITNLDLFVQLTGEMTGGVWSQTTGISVGTALNTTTGILNPNGLIAGTYIFRYTMTGTAPCPNDTEDVTVTIQTCCAANICVPITITKN